MSQSFTHSADSVLSFLAQPGRAFYIPYYQRNYSWDDENATKLITDLFTGIKRTTSKKNNTIFLGTVILHEEKDLQLRVHFDTPNLITKVSNVVDGQQRITSIAMLGCVIKNCINEMSSKIRAAMPLVPEYDSLAVELENQLSNIEELYTVEVRKSGAIPKLKPLIIRAGDVSSNPVSDQWTLAGNTNDFYCSNTSALLSQSIEGKNINEIELDERVDSVTNLFLEHINNELRSVDIGYVEELLQANVTSDGSLFNFMDYPPELSLFDSISIEKQQIYFGGVLLLSLCNFLKNSCHFVVIECLDEGLAFDMFQSLNATGTPLTAFEVFKPLVVKTWGQQYPTLIKPQIDRIEQVFELESSAGGKEELTDRVVVSSALTYNGEELSKKFSDERDWLFELFPKDNLIDAASFITNIGDQAEYNRHIIRPRKTAKNSTNFGLKSHFMQLGLHPDQADISALCIFFLKDAGHQFAHSVISVFYAKLINSQNDTSMKTHAAAEFMSVCKATASFFTLWMGAVKGRFPDAIYRKLFQSEEGNISILSGITNQTSTFIKSKFMDALESNGIYDVANSADSKVKWVTSAKETAWYSKKALCRFALFTASHDAAPSLSDGEEGLFVDGMPNSADMLNCMSWHSSDYEVIEHVATRDRPVRIEYPTFLDENIYPGNNSIVDKIGNLTLLSIKINSSIYSEWPHKVFYYWSLTTPNLTTAGKTGDDLMSTLGISTLPPSLVDFTSASNYLPHLAPLAYRGESGMSWDADFIAQRSQHLCERVYTKMDEWLRP